MKPASAIELVFADGPAASSNGQAGIKRRVVLRLDGDDADVVSLRLDSDLARTRQSKRWAKTFDLDEDTVAGKLRKAAVVAAGEAQQAKRGPDGKSDLRISDLADRFLQSLDPEWHRRYRTIYFQKLGREVALGSLWTLASDAAIDSVAGTVESHEAARGGPGPSWGRRLALFKEALAMAGARLLDKLPRVDDVAQDYTLDKEVLLDRLIMWMLRERTFRADTGNPVTLNYHQWAFELEASDCWCRCFGAAVWGRIDKQGSQPRLAVKGQSLAGDLKYESSRRLAADLRTAGFADTDRIIKVTRVTWRVWTLDPKVISAVSGGNAE